MKERIIGAIVIVALVVLVVPVFLDGPPDNGEMFSERVPLPGQSDQQTQTVVLDRDRKDPVPTQTSPEPAAEAQDQEPTIQQVAEQKVSEPASPTKEPEANNPSSATTQSTPKSSPPVPITTSATGMWAVQLGSFSNQANAERLAADLRKQGFAAFLSQLSTGSGQLHRVRIGPQKDREAAEAMAARLQKAGHKGKVLPHP